jgi:hypothetical protein
MNRMLPALEAERLAGRRLGSREPDLDPPDLTLRKAINLDFLSPPPQSYTNLRGLRLT